MLLQTEAFSIMAGISLTFYFWQFIVMVAPFDIFKGKRIFSGVEKSVLMEVTICGNLMLC